MKKIKPNVSWNLMIGKVFYVRIEDMEKQLTSTNYYLVIQSYPDYKYYDYLGKNVYVYN